ncbi:hypothetical protein D3C87_1368310 [compost metagenome]
MSLSQRRFGVLDLANDSDGVLVEEPPLLRQRDAARGSVNQAGGEALLQPSDAFADCRPRKPHPLGRLGETPCIGNPHKGRHVA